MRWQSLVNTWLQVLLATSINRAGNFITLWDGYGLSEATWEPMSAFIQPDTSINPIFRSYLVEISYLPVLRLCSSIKENSNFPVSVY